MAACPPVPSPDCSPRKLWAVAEPGPQVGRGSQPWWELGDDPISPRRYQGGLCPPQHSAPAWDLRELGHIWPMINTTLR